MFLDIARNTIDKECLAQLVKSFHRSDDLDISDTSIKPEDFSLLASIKHLEQLHLQKLNLEDNSLDSLPNLPQLKVIFLDTSSLSLDPIEFGKCSLDFNLAHVLIEGVPVEISIAQTVQFA